MVAMVFADGRDDQHSRTGARAGTPWAISVDSMSISANLGRHASDGIASLGGVARVLEGPPPDHFDPAVGLGVVQQVARDEPRLLADPVRYTVNRAEELVTRNPLVQLEDDEFDDLPSCCFHGQPPFRFLASPVERRVRTRL
jgi:hypothetical protein